MAGLPITGIVVTFNSAGVLADCLKALTDGGAATLVVDNASDDDTIAVAEANGAQVIRNAANLGYGRANNIGVAAAKTDYVLICNPDAIVQPGALQALLMAADNYPEAGMYAPRVIEPSGREYFKTESFLSPGPMAKEGPAGDVCTVMIQGSCLMMRRDLFLQLGGFDENIFLFYEDDDLCRRLNDQKRALVYVYDAVAKHLLGGSSAPRKGVTYLSRFHQAWSKAYVAKKYGLPSPAWSMMAINGLKYLGALLGGKASRIERYGGSFMGAFKALRGQSAWDNTRLP